MKKILFHLLLLTAGAAAGWAQKPAAPALRPETDFSHDGWYAEMPPALALAKKSGMDMLIDFGGSDWCAPCKWLKEYILAKPEFNDKAAPHFVRVDIDTLAKGLSPGRKERYLALQKQYRVGTFPSVFLATPEGEPYAWTTYVPPTESKDLTTIMAAAKLDNDPARFWRQIEPLIARGKIFRAGLERAKGLTGLAKAGAMVDALSQVRADFLLWYYPAKIEELKTLDPADHRGFLAYLAGCKAYTELEEKIAGGYELNPEVKVADVDALIAKNRLTGETLQQALAMKATLLVIDGQPAAALDCLDEFVAAQGRRGPFDRGDYMPIDAKGLAVLKQSIADGKANGGRPLAQYLALHRIFEGQQLPNRYEISCHASGTSAFEPILAVRMPTCEGYGKALLAATASLEGEAKARALAKGLEHTAFLNSGTISTIINKMIPDLVGGRENAAAILPVPYKAWVAPRPRATPAAPKQS